MGMTGNELDSPVWRSTTHYLTQCRTLEALWHAALSHSLSLITRLSGNNSNKTFCTPSISLLTIHPLSLLRSYRFSTARQILLNNATVFVPTLTWQVCGLGCLIYVMLHRARFFARYWRSYRILDIQYPPRWGVYCEFNRFSPNFGCTKPSSSQCLLKILLKGVCIIFPPYKPLRPRRELINYYV